MPPSPGILELATIAHQLWCAMMVEQGWRPSPVYDDGLRMHDAIVPFEVLAPGDQRSTCLAVESLGLPQALVAAIHYDRGPEREFTARELRIGLPVAWSRWVQDQPDLWTSRNDHGVIIGWELDGGGAAVRGITVRWDSGEVTSHVNSERELRRVGSGPQEEPPHGCERAS